MNYFKNWWMDEVPEFSKPVEDHTPINTEIMKLFGTRDYDALVDGLKETNKMNRALLDMALQEGWTELVKYLVLVKGEKPSLYAKQMAIINGHIAIAFWLDERKIECGDRQTIYDVHYKDNGQWAECIPENCRYTLD